MKKKLWFFVVVFSGVVFANPPVYQRQVPTYPANPAARPAPKQPYWQSRKPTTINHLNEFTPTARIGLNLEGSGLWGRVDYGSASTGLGYSLGAGVKYTFRADSRVWGTLRYQSLGLGRSFSGTGALSDPAGASVDQTQKMLALGVLGGYLLEGAGTWDWGDPNWWLDFGVEYQHPLSGTQTDSFGSPKDFTAGKLLFLVLGGSGEVPVGKGWSLCVAAQGIANVLGDQKFKLVGGRLLLALEYPL